MKRPLAVTVLLSLVLPPLFSQQATLDSIYTSLDELERTLLDIQSENESLKADTETLRRNLTESEAATGRLSDLSAELRRLSTEQEAESRRLSASLEKSERKSRNWRLASLIEGGIIAALLAVIIIR